MADKEALMSAFYNDNDPYVAQWLGNLIAAGELPAGDVDRRSILDVEPGDLIGREQAHFFAGIGGWPYALELADWRGLCWTGSCPCQPLSSAGQRKGHVDERHLWPAFYRLIAECRPPTIFGEQVASKDGREWLAGVRADLESLGYAVGAADLPAACVGAPHIRQRLFWVAHARCAGDECGLQSGTPLDQNGSSKSQAQQRERSGPNAGGRGGNGGLAYTDSVQPQQLTRNRSRSNEAQSGRACSEFTGPSLSFWSDAEWLPCLDGNARRIKPGVFPLAYGISGRVGKLRGAGNAIVPEVAAAFVRAFMELRAAEGDQ